MVESTARLSVNDWVVLEPGQRRELLDGRLLILPPPSPQQWDVAQRLGTALRQLAYPAQLGDVLLYPGEVILSQYDLAQPDLVFITPGRRNQCGCSGIHGAPDLVVEILSASTAQYDQGYKRTLYSRSGVREYWLVDLGQETVAVLTQRTGGLAHHATFRKGDTLDSPLLPGLSVPLERIFG